jgi:signal transduction histidine kinase
VWRDWVLVGVLIPIALLEGILRPDVVWRPFAIVLSLAMIAALLWRRTHPLAVVLLVFGVMVLVTVAAAVFGTEPVGLYSAACVLLLSYALMRWGSGRESVIGMTLVLTAGVLGIAEGYTGVGDAVGATVVFLFPPVLGASVRAWATARDREMEQARMREREQLARELHDTVAHHVSAMVIQAQAGRVLADSRPDAAVEALRVIEAEASSALKEMRTMVGVLRDGEAADLVPQRGVPDIKRLATAPGDAPRVVVELSGDLDDLRPAVGAAIYRLAQESVTNAIRHARHATRIDVRVCGDDDSVRLTVTDDGTPTSAGRVPWGYGLVGMNERSSLLGGTFEAGPGAHVGWTVAAALPRNGSAT